MQRAIAESPEPSRIRSLGERTDVGDLLCAADFFVMPSRFEGLAGSVIEAMALEIPLVLTDIEVFREVADNRALFFRRDDDGDLSAALRRCLTGEYPLSWPAQLRARTEANFDISQVASDLADFYRKFKR